MFAGWTASNVVATAAHIADLSWEIWKEHSLAPEVGGWEVARSDGRRGIGGGPCLESFADGIDGGFGVTAVEVLGVLVVQIPRGCRGPDFGHIVACPLARIGEALVKQMIPSAMHIYGMGAFNVAGWM